MDTEARGTERRGNIRVQVLTQSLPVEHLVMHEFDIHLPCGNRGGAALIPLDSHPLNMSVLHEVAAVEDHGMYHTRRRSSHTIADCHAQKHRFRYMTAWADGDCVGGRPRRGLSQDGHEMQSGGTHSRG